MDGRTEFSSLDHVCIPCSTVKNVWSDFYGPSGTYKFTILYNICILHKDTFTETLILVPDQLSRSNNRKNAGARLHTYLWSDSIYSQTDLISRRFMSHSALCHGILYPWPAPTEYNYITRQHSG